MTEEHIEKAASNRLQRAQKAFAACDAYWGSFLDGQLETILYEENFYVLIDAPVSRKGSLRCDLCYSTPGGIQRTRVKFAARDLLIADTKQKMSKWIGKKHLQPLRRNAVWKSEQVREKSKEEELESMFEAGRVSSISLELAIGCETNAMSVAFRMKEEMKEELLKELQTHIDFGNKFIQRLWGTNIHEDVCNVLLENISGGPLSRVLSRISREKLTIFSRQLHSALLFLEQMDFVHRKLTIDACFLTKEGQLKLAIFCLSSGLVSKTCDRGDVDMCRWIPWECIEAKEYSAKSVVWTYGTLIWSIYHYGAVPFENHEPNMIMNSAFRQSYELPVEETLFPNAIQELVGNCWQDEANRPSFFQMKELLSRI